MDIRPWVGQTRDFIVAKIMRRNAARIAVARINSAFFEPIARIAEIYGILGAVRAALQEGAQITHSGMLLSTQGRNIKITD